MTLFSSSILKILHSAKLLLYCKYLENNLWIHFQFPTKKQKKRRDIIIITFAFKNNFLSFLFGHMAKYIAYSFIDLGIFTEKNNRTRAYIIFQTFFFWGGDVIPVLCSLQLTLVAKCRQVLNNLENLGQVKTCFNKFKHVSNKFMQTCFN